MGLKSYSRDLILSNITNDELHVLSIRVAKHLNWEVVFNSKYGAIFKNSGDKRRRQSNIILNFTDDKPELTSESINGGIYDFGRNRDLIDTFVLELNDLLENLNREEIAKDYDHLKQEFPEQENDILNPDHISHQLDSMGFIDFLIPTKTYFVTPIVIYLNFIVFILMVGFGISPINPTVEQLIQWGGNVRYLTLSGDYWRLLSACFLHIGAIHFLMNMYALVFVGFMVEKRIGPFKYALAYILTGILASLASVFWNDSVVSAGASGAIFGIYGLYLILLSSNIMPRDVRKTFLSSVGFFVLYNLLYGFAKEGVDNSAHIGGLLSGILIGLLYLPTLRENPKSIYRILVPTSAIIATIVLCLIGFKTISNDISVYQKRLEVFIDQESKALRFFTFTDNTPMDTILNEIKNVSTPLWNSNLEIINSCENLDLNTNTKTAIKRLKKYCELRLELNDLYYKTISENSNSYENLIQEKSMAINELLKNNTTAE